MPVVGTAFRIYYLAKNRATSLGDVGYFAVTPSGAIQGMFSMFEFAPGNATLAGLYYADYTPTEEGHYVVFANSTSQPMADQRGFYAENAHETDATAATRTAAILAAIAAGGGGSSIDATLARKCLTNKLIVSSTGLATLYDDDETTPLLVWQINQVNGSPAVADTDSMQRIPV